MVHEVLAALGVRGSGDGGTIIGLLIEQVTTFEDKFALVLQAFPADFGIEDKEVVIHAWDEVAAVEGKSRIERKGPTAEAVAKIQLSSVAIDVFHVLRRVAVGITFPVEILEGGDGQMVYLIDEPQFLPQV